jgi:hypothetical protein
MRRSIDVKFFRKVLPTNLPYRIFNVLDYIYNTITEHVQQLIERGKNCYLVEFHGAGGISGQSMCVQPAHDESVFHLNVADGGQQMILLRAVF